MYVLLLLKDVNECNGDHECDHSCANLDGSYTCSCDPGYELQSDHRSCEGVNYVLVLITCIYDSLLLPSDINECMADNGGCTQTCINIPGSYQCSCMNGYQLANDSRTCTGMCTILYCQHME